MLIVVCDVAGCEESSPADNVDAFIGGDSLPRGWHRISSNKPDVRDVVLRLKSEMGKKWSDDLLIPIHKALLDLPALVTRLVCPKHPLPEWKTLGNDNKI